MIRNAFRDAWNEPAVADPPARVWRDWVLVGLFLPAATIEIIVRDGAGSKPGGLLVAAVLAVAIFWRRTHPFPATVAAFGAIVVMDIAALTLGGEPLEFFTFAIVLCVPYTLFRWGSGRSAMIGFCLMAATMVQSLVFSWTGIGDAIGGALVLFFPAALGDVVRQQVQSRRQAVVDAKSREREQLARELHDTVAHHVSAIAISAQAGQAVGVTRPEAALEALATIEEEASRTLAEMRSMVGALRAGEDAELAPQAGSADIDRLAASVTGPRVRVERHGQLDDVGPSVDRALFRLAQESITNAVRHARNATEVIVALRGDADRVHLAVSDNGDQRPFDPETGRGYGLVGMAERATLLGGELEAGPHAGGGWTVSATLPKTGVRP